MATETRVVLTATVCKLLRNPLATKIEAIVKFTRSDSSNMFSDHFLYTPFGPRKEKMTVRKTKTHVEYSRD